MDDRLNFWINLNMMLSFELSKAFKQVGNSSKILLVLALAVSTVPHKFV